MLFPRLLTTLLLGAAVLVMASGVWLVGQTQRNAARESFGQAEAAHAMLTARLEQETGLRGYLLNGGREFLDPYRRGGRDFARALGAARRAAGGDRDVHALLDRSAALAVRWRALADVAVRRGPGAVSAPAAVRRELLMDDFRSVSVRLRDHLAASRSDALSRATWISAVLILALSALFGIAGWLLVGRPIAAQRKREARRAAERERQAGFARALQMSRSEAGAHAVVKEHLERAVPNATVDVLAREGLGDRSGGTCWPLLVSGEIIGAVRVAHDGPLGEEERGLIADKVTLAAPVIANLRNLAIAEERAATDALTGLANRRALHDTLGRMIAQARRTGCPLAAIALDLDRFKEINDRHGHECGDHVLEATARALRASLRASDFVARSGGEEFVVLLPDTGLDGALVVAENLRLALEAMTVPGLTHRVTGSFGVAVHPDEADDAEGLLRLADRALYAAKRNGRNRVEAEAAPSVI